MKRLKRTYYIGLFLTVAAVAEALPAAAVEFSFTGMRHKVLEVEPEKNSGLDHVYVAYEAAGISSMELSGVTSGVQVQRYSNLGGGYAEPVTIRWEGQNAVVDHPEGNMGYIVTENGRNTCIWLIDYSTQPMRLTAVSASGESNCDETSLSIDGSAPAIHYYTIDGRPVELSRDIEVSYYTETFSQELPGYEREITHKNIPHLSNPLTLTPPLYCSTEVTVTGDRFLREWGMEVSVTSATISPNGLETHTEAVQTNLPAEDEDGSNIINGDSSAELGGSAPAVIRFTAYCTEGVIHDEWQISSDPEFGNTEYRFNEREVEYTFEQEGTYYVRYVGSNADGSCEVYGDVYTVGIGASDLRIPNAFTPNDDGVNDIWKVGYRSLLSFRCWIFDRYGNEIYHFEDPSQGWDGRYKGKLVKPGVYFYVIEATGSDGKKYKKGGDINVVGYKKYGNGTGTDPVPEE